MANPNIVQTVSIYGKTDLLAVGTSAANITSNAGGSGKIYKVNSLMLGSKASGNTDVTVELSRGTTHYAVVKAASVPAGSSIVVLGKENPVYLLEGDSIRVAASSNTAIDALCSYEEIA